MTTFDNNKNIRFEIVDTYSRWTALSATRSGSPLKSRDDIYSLLEGVDFKTILVSDSNITKTEFNQWHEKTAKSMNVIRPEMQIGWTTKIINVYLKTMVYVGQFGCSDLLRHIHPPIDKGLLDGLKEKFKDDSFISQTINFKTLIKDIKSYEDYAKIIATLELIAIKEKCLLIEVEQFWQGTKFRTQNGR